MIRKTQDTHFVVLNSFLSQIKHTYERGTEWWIGLEGMEIPQDRMN